MTWIKNTDDIELASEDAYGTYDCEDDTSERAQEEIDMRTIYDVLKKRHADFKITNLETFADLNLLVSQWYAMAEDIIKLLEWLKARNCNDIEQVAEIVSDVFSSLLNLAIKRVGALVGSTVRTMDGPGTTFLCVVILASALDRVLDNVPIEVLRKVEATRFSNESNSVSATQLDHILRKGVAAFDKPISTYTMSELRTAIILLGDEWENIDITNNDVTEYLTHLFSRACIISNVVQPREVLDVPRWIVTRALKTDSDEDTQLTMANMCFLRFGTAPVCKMLCIVDFLHSVERRRPEVADPTLVSMRRRILRKYRELSSVDQTTKLIDSMCQKSRLRYSDVEQFMDENALSRIDAKIVLDTVHNGESQFSMFWFHRKIDGVSFVEETNEQSAAYQRHTTLNQKLFIMNSKLFCFNALLQHEMRTRNQVDMLFLEKFCYDENDIIRARQSIDNSEYPLILIIQAMPYVLSENMLFECRGMDIALLVWIDCLLSTNNGIVNSISYRDALVSLTHVDVPRDNMSKLTNLWLEGFVSYY
jgi:hypothetical protein